jgi:putative inorganic carbon (hco3(-)) transporter
LILTVLALATIPIARSPSLSWDTFNDTFIRVVLMFIVMVNVIKNEARLRGLMLLSVGIGVYLGVVAFNLYREGKTTVEDYRVGVDFGGMFGNPNELATHFVMFLPISIALALSTKRLAWKLVYLTAAFFMTAGVLVTFSRGAFLGLIIGGFVFAWKIGRNHKVRTVVISTILSLVFLAAAPNGYGLRVLSIFLPGLDAAGSSDQRKELLIQSIIVTLRNPWGIGMRGFTIGSVRNLETHNAFTQVSTDLGILGLIVYILLLTSPIRRLGAVERQLFASNDFSWIYYLSIGVQVSIVTYMVASFFGSFAFNWFVYFPIAYAIALRRIYAAEKQSQEKVVSDLQGAVAA